MKNYMKVITPFVFVAMFIVLGSSFSVETAFASRLAPSPVVLVSPVFMVPADVSIEATNTLTYVDLGTPHWVNSSDGSVYSVPLPTATNNAPVGKLFPVGDTSVTWEYQNANSISTSTATSTQKVTVTNLLKSIVITTPASKLSYTVGDLLDITGLVVTGTYSNTSTSTISITSSDVSGFSSASPAIGQVLTITSGGKTTTYTVDVVAVPVVVSSSGGSSGGHRQIVTDNSNIGQVLGAETVNWANLSQEERDALIKSLQEKLDAIIKLINELIQNGTLN